MPNAHNVPDLFSEIYSDVKKDPFFDAIAFRIYIQQVQTNGFYMPNTDGGFDLVPLSPEQRQRFDEDARDHTFALYDASQEPDVSLYYANEEMSKTVQLAASLLDSSDIGSNHLLPSQIGFCYFEGGVTISDNMTIHGLFWFPIARADSPDLYKIIVHGFNDSISGVDGSKNMWIKKIEERGHKEIPPFRWIWRSITEYKNNGPIALDKTDPTIDIIGSVWGDARIVPINNGQILHALSLLMKQEKEVITVEKRLLVNKNQIKRAKKRRIPTEVTVIDVFRSYEVSGPSSPSQGKEYSRRWLVIGHWRWQKCKDRETGQMVRKRVWVNPYIKGPKDKPFVATKRVHALLK